MLHNFWNFRSRWKGSRNQRAENGVLDPWSLALRVGRPRFLPQIAPKPFKTRVFGLWTENRGAPKTQIQRPRIQRPILGPLTKRSRNSKTFSRLFSDSRGPGDFFFRLFRIFFVESQDFHFLLQHPLTPEGFQKGFLEGSLKGFRRASEGF